jgi:CheY-like chemotaxis protein
MPRVLLIDSDSALNVHLTQELSRYGLEVEATNDSAEVLARKDGLPDLIVLCIDPKKTGWAICNRLRKSTSLKTTPLVITSAEATEKDFEDHKKLKTRAEEYLHKPFGVESLIEKIGGLIQLPMPQSTVSQELEIPLDSEELAIEDADALVDEMDISEENDFDGSAPPQAVTSPYDDDGSEDRTRIGMQSVDDQVDLETDAAFAAIGAVQVEEQTTGVMKTPTADNTGQTDVPPQPLPEANTDEDPFGLGDTNYNQPPAQMAVTSSEPMVIKQPSEDLDLGLDQVAQQAAAEPVRSEPRRRAMTPPPPILSSAPPPPMVQPLRSVGFDEAEETNTAIGPGALIEELKRENTRLARELDEAKAKKPDAVPASSGAFSREREFLNLREIINKKEKEILDLRDSLDGKERTILDGKDKLRELERRSRDLDDKSLATERELMTAREKIEALQNDKDQVVQREKQVKGRLDDALKSVSRYESEIETWKKKHAADTAQLEQTYNQVVQQHQAELGRVKGEQAQLLEQKNEEHATQLRDIVDQHNEEKEALIERTNQERGRLEAEHAKAIAQLRESAQSERESQKTRYETQIAELQQQTDAMVQALRSDHAAELQQLQVEQEANLKEKDQLHADEVAGLRARHTTDTKANERRHADEIAQLREGHKQELAAAEERRQRELQAHAEEHRREMEQLAAEHLKEKGAIERDHEAGVHALDEKHAQELRAKDEAHLAELAKVSSDLEAKHVEDLKALKESHSRKLQALEESHADLKAGMQSRHAQQIEDLKREQGAALAEFENAVKQRDSLISEGHERMAELDAQVAEQLNQIENLRVRMQETDAKLAATVAELADREGKLTERVQRITELEQESAGYQDQILKAYQRIKSDESIVSRAKKALAIALTLLDEGANDGGDEASS